MQTFLEANYQLIISICKLITPQYMDLAHDFIVKFNSEDLEGRKNIEGIIYIRAKNLYIDQLRR